MKKYTFLESGAFNTLKQLRINAKRQQVAIEANIKARQTQIAPQRDQFFGPPPQPPDIGKSRTRDQPSGPVSPPPVVEKDRSGIGRFLVWGLAVVAVVFVTLAIISSATKPTAIKPAASALLSEACRSLNYKNQGKFCDCLDKVIRTNSVPKQEIERLARGFSGDALERFVGRNPVLETQVRACNVN